MYEKLVNLVNNQGNAKPEISINFHFKTSVLASFNTFDRMKCEGGSCRPWKLVGECKLTPFEGHNLPFLRKHFDINL